MKTLLIVAFAAIAYATPAAIALSAAAESPGTGARPLTPDDFNRVRGEYRQCIQAYSEKFTPAKETAGDIAMAALANCQPILRKAFTAPLTPEQIDQTIDRIENDAQKDSIRMVIEKRYRPK